MIFMPLFFRGASARFARQQSTIGKENWQRHRTNVVRHTDSWGGGEASQCHLRFRVFSVNAFHLPLEVTFTSKLV